MTKSLCAMMALSLTIVFSILPVGAKDPQPSTNAIIDSSRSDWKDLTENDFENVNCDPETWKWKDAIIYCTGKPVGVTKSKKTYTNFEMTLQWRHMKHAGNSGVFIWATEDGLKDLKPNQLPKAGIEVQILDHGYAENYEKTNKKKPDWFTTNGDVFPVGKSKMVPFEPKAPKSNRSFPSKNLSKGMEQWNHYYIRAINGEIRLWVNGEEVSGGTQCDPKTGFLCLESEGSPVEFKTLRIRELP